MAIQKLWKGLKVDVSETDFYNVINICRETGV